MMALNGLQTYEVSQFGEAKCSRVSAVMLRAVIISFFSSDVELSHSRISFHSQAILQLPSWILQKCIHNLLIVFLKCSI